MKQKNILSITLLLIILSTFSLYGQSLSDSLQAHYKFDGSLLDETSNNHDLGITNGRISYDFVRSNDSSILFNGASQVTSISSFDNSSFTETSISLWMKSTTVTSDLQICLQGAFMGFGAYIQANTGKFIGFFDGTSSGSYSSSMNVTDGRWHHIVIQNNGDTTFMYIDGVLDGSIVENLNVGNGDSNNKLYLGQSSLGIQSFTGSLNDLRIYNRMLSQCEIDELNGSGSSSATASYFFDGNLADSSVNRNDLQFTGSLSYELFATNDSAIVFDGLSQAASISSFDNSSFTSSAISLWVKSTTITSDFQICLQGAFMGFGAYIQANTGKFVGFFDGTSSGSYASSNSITDGIWHHIVIQNNGSKTFMYVDGVLDGSISENLVVGNGSANSKFYLGQSNLGIQSFTGSLNNINIYDRMLTNCEIDSLSTIPRTVSISEPISKKVNFKVYPNPTDGKFKIDFLSNQKNIDLILTDISGKILNRSTFKNQRYITSEINYPNGVYLLKVILDNHDYAVTKIVKQ